MGWLAKIAIIAAGCGSLSLVIASFSPSYVDAEGLLHEPFAWMATGRLLLLVAAFAIALSSYRRFQARDPAE